VRPLSAPWKPPRKTRYCAFKVYTTISTPSFQTVVYNTQKGSLTKTLYNSELFKPGQHKYVSPQQQLQTQQLQQQYVKKEANGASAYPVAPAPVARENYVEVRKRRKIEKQKKVAFLDLHRKKTDLLAKQLEQQKLLIGQLGKTTDAARKKQIYKASFRCVVSFG
jgi:hypothetical protein